MLATIKLVIRAIYVPSSLVLPELYQTTQGNRHDVMFRNYISATIAVMFSAVTSH